MLKVVDEEVMDILREVVAENPGYIYKAPPEVPPHVKDVDTKCHYVHTDPDGSNVRPGCVVGHVLHHMGIPLDTLKLHEGAPATTVLYRLTDADEYVRSALEMAQTWQDSGYPWAEALNAAEKAYAPDA
ncbi:hypothetical protein LHJ74_30775 [Streptomyces sp. N2-109]|uniref:Uncharacterized protein n=1 Tax=Streptomyces gossypii TaxID=2883101 RepID=A0ABT2K2B5_9ACTN|nr:hypothetical protein [Streptomyces gossypii]MCT2594241.1 hypothetical protein [Streptomyces gossypii]